MFLIRVAAGSRPRPEVQAVPPLEESSDKLFVIDLDVAQNSFSPNSERECLMLRHTSSRALHQDHQHERWMGTVFNRIIYRKRIIIKEEKPTRRDAPRETSGHELNGHGTLETRQLGGILSTTEILKENKKADILSMYFLYKKKQIRHNLLQMWKEAWRVNRPTRKERLNDD